MNKAAVPLWIAVATLSVLVVALFARKPPAPPAPAPPKAKECAHENEIEELRAKIAELERPPAETRIVHESPGSTPSSAGSDSREVPVDRTMERPVAKDLVSAGFSEASARKLIPLLEHWEATLPTVADRNEFHAAVQQQAAGVLTRLELSLFAQRYPHLWGEREVQKKKRN